MVYCWK